MPHIFSADKTPRVTLLEEIVAALIRENAALSGNTESVDAVDRYAKMYDVPTQVQYKFTRIHAFVGGGVLGHERAIFRAVESLQPSSTKTEWVQHELSDPVSIELHNDEPVIIFYRLQQRVTDGDMTRILQLISDKSAVVFLRNEPNAALKDQKKLQSYITEPLLQSACMHVLAFTFFENSIYPLDIGMNLATIHSLADLVYSS
eukprot:CAMPEP_0170143456 /NCGR_PEP_ID=MMETSP0033_2-20121228/11021_1 /TAXON_ID=195969 /ORGANISM="Dolichomastix tenuilepis, Strain CCMP3274" /LENGTH=203 /DNA_ID=CAMNT_0010379905 /DNA_START=248 /DNA_END=859 /DNA_ORIENTATION=+